MEIDMIRTKEEIFGPGWPYLFDASKTFYTKEHTFQRADEYAEEYAKAFFVFCRKKVGEPELAEYLSNSYMQDFKESLKK